MKILHCIPSVNPEGGGPIEGIKQRATVLLQDGHEVAVVCLDSPDSQWVKNFPFQVHALGPAKSRYCYSNRLVPWLRTNSKKYDAIIVNGIWQYHSLGAWLALRGGTVPYFVFTHGMLDPWFRRVHPLKHLKKLLYWPWGDYRVLRDAKAVLFTSEEELLQARRSFSLYQCNEKVVQYGTSGHAGDIEEQRKLFMTCFPEVSDKRILLYMGRIHPKKGCDILIQAFAEVARRNENLHLVIAGPDQVEWRQKLVILANEFGVSNQITWAGMLSGDMKWGAYMVADAFILPSHQENFGIVVAEALSCGLPVLISDKVNIYREIQADGAGFVAGDTYNGTVTNLERWLALGMEDCAVMAARAKHCFDTRFHIRRSADSLLEVITNVS